MDIRVVPDEAAAASAAARAIAARLRDAVRRRGRASVAVSGGSTPAAMFGELARLSVPWRSVVVVQVDERMAPLGSPDRNATALHQRLVDRLGDDGPTVHLLPVEAGPGTASQQQASAVIDRLGPIDVVHLGLGDDGHTASWPPGTDVAHAAGPVTWTPEFRGFRRMTLTAAPVNAARSRLVLVTGAAKAKALRRWLDGDPAVPIQAVRRSRSTVILDEAIAVAAGIATAEGSTG